MTEADPRRLLGAFIRAHRERTPPQPHASGRRRTSGLRREELAEAAGLGVTWITWLEQGREINPSLPALCRLARALNLTPAERASLFDLAGKRDPEAPQRDDEGLTADILALPGQFIGPAYLLDQAWTARSWNDEAAALFVGWLDDGPAERNLLAYTFLSPAARSLIANWEGRARRLAAEFHADFNRRPTDPAMQALVDRLLGESRSFAQFWQKQDVRLREGGERAFRHPVRGELSYRQATLIIAQAPDAKLVCLTEMK